MGVTGIVTEPVVFLCKCSFVRVLSRARTHAQALATNSGWNAYGDCRAAINNLASRVLTYSS